MPVRSLKLRVLSRRFGVSSAGFAEKGGETVEMLSKLCFKKVLTCNACALILAR